MEMDKDGAANANMVEKLYPPALLSHGEVVKDREAFMDTLRRFHSLMGTKFMIPVIGGKDLDLHVLYVEVTNRGGLAKVIEEKKWREVIAQFRFPATTTSASYVLRRYYLSLLHHYEQVYYFRAQGALVPPAASALTKTPLRKMHRGSDRPGTAHAAQAPEAWKRAFPERQAREPCDFNVTGSIDGKFEHGYFVTVKIGMETLRGVLYRVAPPPPGGPGGASSSAAAAAAATAAAAAGPLPPNNVDGDGDRMHSRSRHKRGWMHCDLAHPKPNRSAYNFFKEKHAKLRALHPHREREYSKTIGDSWNQMSEEDKMVYYSYGAKDKERYEREMQAYNDRLKLVPSRGMAMAGSTETRTAAAVAAAK